MFSEGSITLLAPPLALVLGADLVLLRGQARVCGGPNTGASEGGQGEAGDDKHVEMEFQFQGRETKLDDTPAVLETKSHRSNLAAPNKCPYV